MNVLVVLLCTASALRLDETSLIQLSEFDSFTGNVTYNSEDYQVSCECDEQGIVEIEEVKCKPTKIKLVQNQEGEGASYEEISKKLEGDFAYAEVTRSSFSCLDGRITEEALGAPGGDAGEFVLGLIVYEDITGKQLSEEEVQSTLEKYLECMGPSYFYMCTDADSVDHIEKELAVEDIEILSPQESLQEDILEVIDEPSNIGDLHLRLLIEYPDLYSVNSEVVNYFIKAFYKILWDKENPLSELLYLEVLEGSHKETAFLEITTNKECLNEQVAPLVLPKDEDLSVFVNHLEAVLIRRSQTADFFSQNLEGVSFNRMLKRLNHHGVLFLDVTGSYISKELPFYTAAFV